jgi:hypothetical protein
MKQPLEPSTMPQPIKLTVEDFLKLKASGAFGYYSKAELLEGELWGVIRAPDGVDQWDHMVPILLRPIDHELLESAGSFLEYKNTKLIHGIIFGLESDL